MNRILVGTILGSFRFKREIDAAEVEFGKLGVAILAPEKGLPWRPRRGFLPLESELYMDRGQVEDEFLKAVGKADFIYVVNPDGYVGETVAFELGFAIGAGKPIYAQEPVNPKLDLDPLWRKGMQDFVTVASVPEVVDIERTNLSAESELRLTVAEQLSYYSVLARSRR